MYMRATFTLPKCTRGLFRDRPGVPRDDLLEVDAHLKNESQCKIEELNS
jgi:hypothetical protein